MYPGGICREWEHMHLVLFFIFGAVCVGAAINLLVQKHPINSALSLIVVMGSLALLYLLLGAEFVAAVQVIVYAGAVMVLFVFVIMLVRLDVALHQIQFSKQKWVSLLVATALGAQVGVMLWATRKMPGQGLFVREAAPADKLPPNSEALAQSLFSGYLLPFEIASVLLLVAMVGAVVMAKRRSEPE